MKVELLVVPDCPNELPAQALAAAALTQLDLAVSITTTVIADDAAARARCFIGSPTFLIDGRDPFAEPDAMVGVACWLYRTPSGLAGVPTLEALSSALHTAATRAK